MGVGGLVSAGLSALGGKKKSGMATTSQTTMPAWQRRHAEEALKGAQTAFRAPEQAMGYQTAMGGMLTQNPYMEEMVRQAQQPITEQYREAIAPGTSSQFAMGGRFGSGLFRNKQQQQERELARQLGETASRMYGQQYGQERALQQQMQQQLDPLERARQYAAIAGSFGGQAVQQASSRPTAGAQLATGALTLGQQKGWLPTGRLF